PRNDGAVLTEQTVSREWREFLDQPGNVVREMRPRRMASHECLLPWRELGIRVSDEFVRLPLKTRNVLFDFHGGVLSRELPQLEDLSLQFSYGTFKFEIRLHKRPSFKSGPRGQWQRKSQSGHPLSTKTNVDQYPLATRAS